jgi:hypothetical protein
VGDARVRKKRERRKTRERERREREGAREARECREWQRCGGEWRILRRERACRWLAEEERSTDGEDGFGEEVDEISRVRTREKDAAVRRGVTLRRRRVVVGCCGPEGSDFAAEESCGEGDPDAEEGYEEYEEDDPDAEEGYEGVWDEVQEALSAMEHEEFDATAEAEQGLKRRDPLRHHPKRQCGLRMCSVYLYLFISCVQLRLSSEDFQW